MPCPTILAPTAAHAAPATASTSSYTYQTIDNPADPTFNQLLGINSRGVVAGYFGSGAAGHPNQGYVVNKPYSSANFVSENFPGSQQTQVTAINNTGDTAGFWVGGRGDNHGFVEWNGAFTSYNDPPTPHIKDSVNQLLGINNDGIAVGFYNDAAGRSHASSPGHNSPKQRLLESKPTRACPHARVGCVADHPRPQGSRRRVQPEVACSARLSRQQRLGVSCAPTAKRMPGTRLAIPSNELSGVEPSWPGSRLGSTDHLRPS